MGSRPSAMALPAIAPGARLQSLETPARPSGGIAAGAYLYGDGFVPTVDEECGRPVPIEGRAGGRLHRSPGREIR